MKPGFEPKYLFCLQVQQLKLVMGETENSAKVADLWGTWKDRLDQTDPKSPAKMIQLHSFKQQKSFK
jgi:hypothetical protein